MCLTITKASGPYYLINRLWIFYVFVLSCVCYVLCASVYMCFVVTCWERADLLALVCGVYCEFVTFPLVSWVRCGTWLYRFLIFAPLLTLSRNRRRVWSPTHWRAIKEESKVANRDWVDHQATLLQQSISEPIFYGELVYKFKRIFGTPYFSDQFKKIIKRYIKIRYTCMSFDSLHVWF